MHSRETGLLERRPWGFKGVAEKKAFPVCIYSNHRSLAQTKQKLRGACHAISRSRTSAFRRPESKREPSPMKIMHLRYTCMCLLIDMWCILVTAHSARRKTNLCESSARGLVFVAQLVLPCFLKIFIVSPRRDLFSTWMPFFNFQHEGLTAGVCTSTMHSVPITVAVSIKSQRAGPSCVWNKPKQHGGKIPVPGRGIPR